LRTNFFAVGAGLLTFPVCVAAKVQRAARHALKRDLAEFLPKRWLDVRITAKGFRFSAAGAVPDSRGMVRAAA
jgi:hypothetical protein